MISKYYDKILLVGALLVLLVVFGFAAFRPDPQPITAFVDIPALRPENTYQVTEVPDIDLTLAQWEEPGPQSAGPEWVFDVFTPPVIFFDQRTGQFVLPDVDVPAPPEFGIELVSIEEELYRMQVVGFFGRDDSVLVTLENVETGEQVLARSGQEFSNFGIVVRSVRTERVQVRHGGTTDVTDTVAFVVVEDKRLGQEVTLRSDQRKKDAEPTAQFRTTDDARQRFRARAGDSFRHNGVGYRVETLTPPASATVTRMADEEQGGRETKTLRVNRAAP